MEMAFLAKLKRQWTTVHYSNTAMKNISYLNCNYVHTEQFFPNVLLYTGRPKQTPHFPTIITCTYIFLG